MPVSTTASSPPAVASPHDLWYDTGNGNRRSECVAAVTWPFAAAANGWTGTHATAVQTTGLPGGLPALLVTADGTGSVSWYAASPSQAVNPGDVVSAQAAVFCPATVGTPLAAVSVNIAWYDGSSALISVTTGTAVPVAVNATATVAVSGTAPATAASYRVQAADAENSPAGAQLLASGAVASRWALYQYGTGSVMDGTVINNGTVFTYSGAHPAAGTLIGSVSAAGGTDGKGNAYLPGTVSYTHTGSGYYAVQAYGGSVQFLTAATYAGPYTQQVGLALDSLNGLLVTAGSLIFAADPSVGFDVNGPLMLRIGAAAEAWHNVTPPSGASGLLRYQAVASPPSCMLVQGQLTFSPAVSGTVSLWTIPGTLPAYIPASDFREPASCGSAGMGTLEVTTGGVVRVLNVPAGTTEIDFCKTVPLN